MLEETLAIVAIIGGCGVVVWYAKSKFQPGIERNLERTENATYKRSETFQRNPKHPPQQ
ncbi:MAG TPA: hypothetical protein VHA09_06350 [Nitrososphaera sp.]|nr:hypothetical protein [Nitrososphaera sp.]